jgi:hypothetical protein
MSARSVHIGLPLLALIAIVGFSGCGGDDASGRQSGYTVHSSTVEEVAAPPITKAQFDSHINKACREAWVTMTHNWYFYRRRQPETMSRDARFANAVQYSLLLGVDFLIFDEMHLLGSPPRQQHVIERIIGSMQLAVETGERGHWHAHSIADLEREFAAYNVRARRYGLNDCLVNQTHLKGIES